jgi:hypothetical protein
MKICYLLFLLANLPLLHAVECTRYGKSIADEGWSKQIKRVCLFEGVPVNTFRSPDSRKLIVADSHGFHLQIDGSMIAWPEGRNLFPSGSEVAWSPTSSAFFINYANGSGLDGWTLRVFVLSDSRLIEHQEINKEIVRRFRAAIGCSARAEDPNVRGLGWSTDGSLIYSFAQSTVNESCGKQGSFRGIVAGLTGEPVREFYSEIEAKRKFINLLPYNMR